MSSISYSVDQQGQITVLIENSLIDYRVHDEVIIVPNQDYDIHVFTLVEDGGSDNDRIMRYNVPTYEAGTDGKMVYMAVLRQSKGGGDTVLVCDDFIDVDVSTGKDRD